jgi:hypothetical protein
MLAFLCPQARLVRGKKANEVNAESPGYAHWRTQTKIMTHIDGDFFASELHLAALILIKFDLFGCKLKLCKVMYFLN